MEKKENTAKNVCSGTGCFRGSDKQSFTYNLEGIEQNSPWTKLNIKGIVHSSVVIFLSDARRVAVVQSARAFRQLIFFDTFVDCVEPMSV